MYFTPNKSLKDFAKREEEIMEAGEACTAKRRRIRKLELYEIP